MVLFVVVLVVVSYWLGDGLGDVDVSPEYLILALVGVVFHIASKYREVRDEETFVHDKLMAMMRPGDLVWLEVGQLIERPENDPLFPLTRQDKEPTAAYTHRRLLLEGPYRRWEAAKREGGSSV